MHCPFSRDCQTRLPSHSWLQRVCVQMCLLPAPTRPRADASALTRLCRRVRSAPTRPRADASAPTRLHRRVCSDTSGPTRLRRRVCADASGPTCLHRRVSADASPLACQNMDFCSKTLIPLETSSQNSKKHQAKSLVLQKMITPIAIAEFSR